MRRAQGGPGSCPRAGITSSCPRTGAPHPQPLRRSMDLRFGRRGAPLALALVCAPACTLVSVDSASGPPGLRANGLVDGHAAFGFRDEDHVLHLDLFDGSSPGAIGELVIWRSA